MCLTSFYWIIEYLSFTHFKPKSFTAVSYACPLMKPLYLGPFSGDHPQRRAIGMLRQPYTWAIERLQDINSHAALVVLQASFGAVRIQHIIHCTPCGGSCLLDQFDNTLRQGVSTMNPWAISNMQLSCETCSKARISTSITRLTFTRFYAACDGFITASECLPYFQLQKCISHNNE